MDIARLAPLAAAGVPGARYGSHFAWMVEETPSLPAGISLGRVEQAKAAARWGWLVARSRETEAMERLRLLHDDIDQVSGVRGERSAALLTLDHFG